MVKIKGRTFVVSGGVSGLGLSAVHSIVEGGGSVAVFDRDSDAGTKLEKEIGPKHCKFYATDVSSTESIKTSIAAVIEWIQNSGHALGGVVTAAGIGINTPAITHSGQTLNVEHWDQVLRVNTRGSIDLATQLLPHWIKDSSARESIDGHNPDNDRGAIVFVSSIASFEGSPGMSAYAASKAAIMGAVLPLARELGEYGIRVVSIAPGAFQTPMYESIPEAVTAGYLRSMPFPKRAGNPERYFGPFVVHILENAFINGTTLRLDGGLRMPWEALE
ncbi:short chain dehydrogenase [Paraphoma chrysanthemicola]|uniref:Short chain dehydrogenase n=1 Tax=Paraphoma chrysanthemicola TaxID=798071 RepID=A0A8K0VST2_9PLEO|nr:short chain dehydrogenase [Paraphoma chrysanthemicola]